MSQGDNLKGIQNIYKGITMRSLLESRIAYLLDKLNIIWIYEPKVFMLSSGIIYKPDFYLPELKQWIEVKGEIKSHNEEISKQFVKDNCTTLLLISYKDIKWFSYLDGNYDSTAYSNELVDTAKEIQIFLCPHCNKYYFCDLYGSWHCRNCNIHEGDHGFIKLFDNLGHESLNGSFDLSSTEKINQLIEEIKNGRE